jgi:hypothetical protein
LLQHCGLVVASWWRKINMNDPWIPKYACHDAESCVLRDGDPFLYHPIDFVWSSAPMSCTCHHSLEEYVSLQLKLVHMLVDTASCAFWLKVNIFGSHWPHDFLSSKCSWVIVSTLPTYHCWLQCHTV